MFLLSSSLLLLAKHQTETEAFVQRRHLCPRHGYHSFGCETTTPPLMAKPDSAASSSGDDDAEFYRDLRRAKAEKLGGSIPPEQARASAAQAEADFLRAMRETKEEFERNKAELGSEGAIDIFLDRIREEDEKREYDDEDADDYDYDEYDDDDDDHDDEYDDDDHDDGNE